jgi:hypothetical protein
MAGHKKGKRVRFVQGVNPRQCPNHGEPTIAGDATACGDCDKAVRGIADKCWEHGEIHEPDPELLRGAPAPLASTLSTTFRQFLIEVPGHPQMRILARNRPAARKVVKKLLQIDKLSPGTRIVELTS